MVSFGVSDLTETRSRNGYIGEHAYTIVSALTGKLLDVRGGQSITGLVFSNTVIMAGRIGPGTSFARRRNSNLRPDGRKRRPGLRFIYGR